MSPAFKRAVTFVIEREGGSTVTDDPADPGGLTKYGISKRAHPTRDIRNLTLAEAEGIYYSDYWLPIHGDELPEPLALAVFDAAVNQGRVAAVELLQRLLRVESDGVVGPDTIGAARRTGISKVVEFFSARLQYYEDLTKRRPVLDKYSTGWRNRVLWAMREATKLEGSPS